MYKNDKISTIKAINLTLNRAMSIDRSIVILGEDIADPEGGGVFGVTKGLSSKYGYERVRTTPISEQAIIGAAIGAAMAGLRPIAEIMMMNFTASCMDMIVNHAAKLRFMSGGQTAVPLTIRVATGAGMGTGGQHADYLEAIFAHVPGIKVVTYSNPSEASGLLMSSIFDDDPVIFIENTPSYQMLGSNPLPDYRIPLSTASVVREGSDLTVICYGPQVNNAIQAALNLAKEFISIEVIDLRTIVPWDQCTVIASVSKTKRAIVIHEASKNFGVGAEISSVIHEKLFANMLKPVLRLGSPSCPVPYSKILEKEFVPSIEKLENVIRKMIME